MLLDLNDPLTFPALVDDRTEYQLAGGDDATITSVRLGPKGGSLAVALDVTFSGHGHTLVIASAPHPDALATVELSATE